VILDLGCKKRTERTGASIVRVSGRGGAVTQVAGESGGASRSSGACWLTGATWDETGGEKEFRVREARETTRRPWARALQGVMGMTPLKGNRG